MGVQIYCGFRMPSLITPEELEDMLDFSDIGGVYDNNTPIATAANTTALQNFLDSRQGTDGIQIAFTGNRLSATYNDKRQPGKAYFDLSSGPITYYPATDHAGDLWLHGLPGSKIIGVNPPSATTPIFELQRDIGGMQSFRFTSLEFQNGLGSGIKFYSNPGVSTGPGARTVFEDCYWHYIGTSLAGGSIPTIDYDDWTDLDSAVYAVWFEEGDGGHFLNCSIQGVNGHGIISKRWHEAVAHLQIRECLGSAVKAQGVNGTSLNLRAESNQGYGLHVRTTGNDRYSGDALQTSGNGTANAWEVWLEANNGRGATADATKGQGYRYRQMKVDGSSRITVGGHSGWTSGKVNVAEPSRRSCRFIEEDYIDPSPGDAYCTLQYDMNNNGADLTNNNWATVWPSVGDRPTIASAGDTGDGTYEVTITVPPGAYDAANGSAYWLPIPSGLTIADGAQGDTWLYTAEISVNEAGVTYCTSREELAVPQRMPAYLGSISIRPVEAPINAFSLWSQASRKFSGRVSLDQTVTGMGLTTYIYFSGMDDVGGSGLQYPVGQIQLRIRSLKLYRIQE